MQMPYYSNHPSLYAFAETPWKCIFSIVTRWQHQQTTAQRTFELISSQFAVRFYGALTMRWLFVTHMVNKMSVCLSGTADLQSQQMAYINTCVAFLCFVRVFPSGFFLLVCFSFCLRHFQFWFRFIFFPFSLLIYFLLSFFLFSIHSVFSCIYKHTYITSIYLVCTHLPLIYFTN